MGLRADLVGSAFRVPGFQVQVSGPGVRARRGNEACLIPSVRQRIEHDVDADRVAAGREEVEVLLAFAFALPGVGDVGVVRH
jgi:hypothetical protein